MKKHIAGIIPVSGVVSDFQLPWHPCLMPISQNYLAIERAVAECAYAGCSTVWIVCNDDTTPLVRYRVGEKIQDPVYNYRHFEYNKNDFKRPIRIYYVPLAIRDLGKRDNLAWSAIYGALTAEKVSKSISKWLSPDRYYIAWPYGCYNPSVVRKYRKQISESSFLLSYQGKTFKDNLYLGVTLNQKQIHQLVSQVKTTSTGLWVNTDNKTEKLSKEERFSYRKFDLKKVFEQVEIKSYKTCELEDYFSIDSWSAYRNMLSSDLGVKRPSWLSSGEWNEIGLDEEKD